MTRTCVLLYMCTVVCGSSGESLPEQGSAWQAEYIYVLLSNFTFVGSEGGVSLSVCESLTVVSEACVYDVAQVHRCLR